MYELSLESNYSHLEHLEKLKNSLEEIIIPLGGVIISGLHAGRAYITLAVPKLKRDIVKSVVLEKTSETIVSIYKSRYLDEEISSGYLPHETKSMLVMALSEFDKDTDIDIVKKNMVFSDYLVLDSLYHFKMQELRSRWRDIVSLVNSNLPNLIAGDSVVEMMKFLIGTTSPKTNEVYLSLSNDNKLLICKNNKMSREKMVLDMERSDFEERLISTLISLAPRKIYVETQVHSNLPCMGKIENLFESKIYTI